jgi:hypothetical protein
MPVPVLLVALLALPAAMLVAHAIAYRAMAAGGRRPTAHTSAITGILGCGGVVLAAVAIAGWSSELPLFTVACQLLYTAAVTVAMGILYLDVVNVAETSLHMHLLLRVAWGERLTIASLLEQYSPDRIVAERLDRLTALGQIRREDGRFFVANRTTLRLSRLIDAWRRVIGLPTSPDEMRA